MFNFQRTRIAIAITVSAYLIVISVFYRDDNQHSTPPSPRQLTTKQFTILIWTDFFSERFSDDYNQFNCGFPNCRLTHDRMEQLSADAILIHLRNVDLNDLPMYKRKGQKFVMFNMESPVYSGDPKVLEKFGHNLDWFMSYRRDSELFKPYGRVIPKELDDPSNLQIAINKTKSVVWFVSNCRTQSRREEYVSELSNYIDVDIYGQCGSKQCSKSNSSECFDIIESNYKFYLSFENSLCKDYVTEKLFNLMKYDVIPIVRGSANYEKFLPPNSYIDTANFSSPKQLANYLNYVQSNDTIYKSYFEWKSKFRVDTDWFIFCDICAALNRNLTSTKRSGREWSKWWFDDQCSFKESFNH